MILTDEETGKKYEISERSDTNLRGQFEATLTPIPAPAKRWRAEKGGEYWYVNVQLGVTALDDNYQVIDNGLHESGNYFQSEQVADAAAQAVRAVLEYIHEPADGDANKNTYPSTFIESVKAARQAVQDGAA